MPLSGLGEKLGMSQLLKGQNFQHCQQIVPLHKQIKQEI